MWCWKWAISTRHLNFYGAIFDFELRGRSEVSLFVDLGDQFIQFTKNNIPAPDTLRHFGLVVDDRDSVREALAELGVELLERGLNFRDPWGNRVEGRFLMTTSSLPRRHTCCMVWAPTASRRPKRRSHSSPRRAWRRRIPPYAV